MLSGTDQCRNCHSDLRSLSCGPRPSTQTSRSDLNVHQRQDPRRRARLDRRLSQEAHNRRHKGHSRRHCVSCQSMSIAEAPESDWDSDGWTTEITDRGQHLRDWVKKISPESVEAFMQNQPADMCDAVQQLIFDQLGRLPPQFFQVTYFSSTESLAEYMKMFMHWGYALRNAHSAVEDLDRMLQAGCAPQDSQHQEYALPVMSQCLDSLRVHPLSRSKLTQVSGEVSQWDPEKGEVKYNAEQYIRQLESQNEILQDTVSTQLYVNSVSNRCNRYLTYLTTLPKDKQELTWHISNDIKEAMSVFIHMCLDTDCILADDWSERDQAQYAQLLMYCLVAGYLLRQEEMFVFAFCHVKALP